MPPLYFEIVLAMARLYLILSLKRGQDLFGLWSTSFQFVPLLCSLANWFRHTDRRTQRETRLEELAKDSLIEFWQNHLR